MPFIIILSFARQKGFFKRKELWINLLKLDFSCQKLNALLVVLVDKSGHKALVSANLFCFDLST
jgi:hypothetical protein